MRDPYQTLGVSREASAEDIKKRYRTLARELHPDLNPGDAAAEARFKDVSEAYALLSDPERRASYDRGELREEAPGAGAQGNPFYSRTQRQGGRYDFGFEDLDESILDAIFGGGLRGRARAGAAPRAHYALEVDFREAVRGGRRRITLPDGRTLDVRIPAGIESGQKLRLRGHEPGEEVLLEVHVRPSERFSREGKDVHVEVDLPLDTAVNGGEIRVPTLDGEVLLKVPPGTDGTRRFRVKGKGVASDPPGDEYVRPRIVFTEEALRRLRTAPREKSPNA